MSGKSKRTKALSDAELRRLLQVVKAAADTGDVVAKRDYALLLFSVFTGMRRQEIIQLQWGDLQIAETLVLMTQLKGGTYRTKESADPSLKPALLEYLSASGRLGALTPESPRWIAHDPAKDTAPGLCKRNPKKPKVVRARRSTDIARLCEAPQALCG